MIAGPMVLLAAVAINGHGGAPTDDRAVFGEENHKRLLSYVGPVRASNVLSAESPHIASGDLDKAIEQWLALQSDGTESTVMPVDFETPTQDTVLGDIREGKITVLYYLTQRVQAEAKAGRYDKAALGLVQSMKIAAVDKYTEFSCVHQFGQMQLRYANALIALSSKLTPEVRRWALAQLTRLQSTEGKLKSIAWHMRELHCASLARKGQVATTIELSEGYGALAEVIDTRSAESLAKLRQVSVRANMPLEMASIGTVARLAVRTEDLYQAEMDKAILALQSVK